MNKEVGMSKAIKFNLKKSLFNFKISAIMSHLFGAMAGLCVGTYALVNLNVLSWQKKLSVMALIAYIIFLFTGLIYHLSASPTRFCR